MDEYLSQGGPFVDIHLLLVATDGCVQPSATEPCRIQLRAGQACRAH